MDVPEEAQKILLQGWEENKDAFNCLNNYFVNINTIQDLNHTIQDLYAKTPSDKKLIYLEAMKHEFKKIQNYRKQQGISLTRSLPKT
ncbi:hypothetical protein [Chryseobacterium indoltheticum]|uniref:hypothetical protein n=1 Tax=Chryseobacterium indoltheticum TaxID=254 RepID=UPI003F498C76